MLLKELYSTDFIQRLAVAVQAVQPNFEPTQFMVTCLADDWAELKLMERSQRITEALHDQFPADFATAAKLLRTIGPQFTGLAAVCLPNYVATYGLDDWDASMATLAVLTRYSSAEFAIRPFLLTAPQKTAAQMLRWAQSSDVDLRRLSSEGMRPRLPWGIRLKPYVADPTPIWPVLTTLIFDAEPYVQKSVANNLNDISKDHPDLVLAFAQRYWHRSVTGDWVLQHGLRTLFKQGVPAVLSLLGYDPHVVDQLSAIQLSTATTTLKIGEQNQWHYALTNKQVTAVPVYLGYRVHYVRKNKRDAFKDFYVKRLQVQGHQTVQGTFKIKWRQLSTRRLYPGSHQVDLLVNTTVVATTNIDLLAN